MKKENIYEFYNPRWLTTVYALSDYYIEEMKRNLHDEKGRVLGNWLWDGYKIGLGIYPDWVKFPIVFHVVEGKKFRDIIDTEEWNKIMLISDKLKLLLEKENVTGWKFYPIKLFNKDGSEVVGYHGFSVIGRGGEFEDKDEYSKHERVINNIKWKYRLSNWDGSDFFYIEGGFFYVTEKVKNLFKTYKIDSAIRFEPWSVAVELVE